MPVTARIPMERLAEYFDTFTQRFLRDGSAKALDVEVLEPDLGDQYAAEGARLRGITYDATSGALEFDLDSGGHQVNAPVEVWTIEEDDGFLSAIEIVRADMRHEVVSVKRVGLQLLS